MAPAIDLRPDHRKIVEDILHEHLPAGVKVWVFGSRAEWATKDSSDLDLALDGDGPLDTGTLIELELAFEDSLLPFRVDVVDLARVEDGFREIVEVNRKPWHKDPTARRDWTRGVLADACKAIDYGLTASASSDAKGPKFLRITDIVSGHIDWSSVPYVTVDDAMRAKYKLHDGDIVIARTGASTGASAFVKAPPDAVFASYLVRLQARKEYDARFLAYSLKSDQFWNFLRGVLGDKSAQPNASASTITRGPLRAPRRQAEQRAIGRVLGALDDRIDMNRRMNERLEAMARALFKSWFVDFDPVRAKMEGRDTGLPPDIADLFPNRLVASELGAIPEGWEVGVLTDVIELLSGGTPRTAEPCFWNGDIPWYTPKDAPTTRDVFVTNTARTITQEGVDNSSTTVLPARTTVISARGTVGQLACLGEPMAINQTCYGVRGIDGYRDFFTYWLIRQTCGVLRARTHGTVFDTITRQTFALVAVPLPPVSLAQAFEATVAAIMELILSNLHQISSLARLRDTLLPRLVSGEVRLPTALVDCCGEPDGPVVL